MQLWKGVVISVFTSGPLCIRAALLCISCDLPAVRKICGFASYSNNNLMFKVFESVFLLAIA